MAFLNHWSKAFLKHDLIKGLYQSPDQLLFDKSLDQGFKQKEALIKGL